MMFRVLTCLTSEHELRLAAVIVDARFRQGRSAHSLIARVRLLVGEPQRQRVTFPFLVVHRRGQFETAIRRRQYGRHRAGRAGGP